MLEFFVYSYGNQILMAALCAIFGVVGYGASRLARRVLDDDTKRAVARSAVMYVEQVFTMLHGQEKLREALDAAERLLGKKGIAFDAEEMMVLIEAAVGEFNRVARSGIGEWLNGNKEKPTSF